jgi:hypothetical protein
MADTSNSPLMAEVAALTEATTELLTNVNVRKATLNEKVDEAAASAQASALSASASNDSAQLSATALVETELARDTTLTYRDEAIAVVTSNDGSFESAPGKVPVAGLDGKIDYDYLPLLEHNAKVAEALINGTHENLQDFFEDREVSIKLTQNSNQLSELTAHVDSEVNRLNQSIDSIEPGIPPVYKGLIEQDFLVDGFESAYTAEILRGMGGSGLYSTRNYSIDDGFQALHRPFTVTSTAQFQHNHPNYYRMVGLGELCAIVNGYYVRTTHNDPTLIDQDGAILSAPDVPPSVLAKPTGISLNSDGSVSIDTAGDTQARYMRNLFTDSLEDTRLDLLYLEVWLEKLPVSGELNTTIQSFRHQENANKLRDLLNFAEKLNFSGAKDLPENGSFRSGIITLVDDNGVPEYAYVNYRLRARSVGKLADRVTKTSYTPGDQTPAISFGVVASSFGGTHGHALDVPLTADEMNSLLSGDTLYVETSYGKSPASPDAESHSHLREVRWNGTSLVGISLGARAVGAEADTFLAVSSTPPTITSYRKSDGSYGGAINWITETSPHQHPMDVQIIQDRFPFNLDKAVHHVIDGTNRFKLIKDHEALNRLRERNNSNASWVDLALSGLARFTLDQDSMDSLCSQVWGLDGEGAYIPEAINSYGTTFTTYNVVGSAQANLAKYNRTYKIGTNDAAGRTVARRGFNDPTLYVARTTKPNVVEGYSYMIPLELIVRSPLEIWNPWNLITIDGNGSQGTGAGTQASPWNAAYTRLWWNLMPPKFFSAGVSDPADTTSGGVWIKAQDGNAYPADNSGITITRGNAANYRDANNTLLSNTFRFRYAIAPAWHEFTYANIQLNNFKNTLKEVLKDVVAGTATDGEIDKLL